MTKKKKPSLRQEKFIRAYNGNIKETAERVGLSYGYAKQLMCMPKYEHVRLSLTNRSEEIANLAVSQMVTDLRNDKELIEKCKCLIGHIATRKERQAFWSNVLLNNIEGEEIKIADRLKAAELLARSQGDFIERRKLEFDRDSLNAIFTAVPADIAAELRIRLAAKLGFGDT
jgi:hypothetical protein